MVKTVSGALEDALNLATKQWTLCSLTPLSLTMLYSQDLNLIFINIFQVIVRYVSASHYTQYLWKYYFYTTPVKKFKVHVICLYIKSYKESTVYSCLSLLEKIHTPLSSSNWPCLFLASDDWSNLRCSSCSRWLFSASCTAVFTNAKISLDLSSDRESCSYSSGWALLSV